MKRYKKDAASGPFIDLKVADFFIIKKISFD